MLQGSIAPLGTSYVVRLDAIECQSGEALAREQAEAADQASVLQQIGSISSRMRTRLGESLPSLQQFDVPIEQATTPSLTALKAYALGLEERRRGRELESVAFFNQAIELDPEFASAYATLHGVREPGPVALERGFRKAGVCPAGARQSARAPLHHLPVPAGRLRHRRY